MTNRSSLRIAAALAGAGLLLSSPAGWAPLPVGIILGGGGLFLAATDFGRQCPLLLSLRNLRARMRHRHTTVTTKDIHP